MKIPSETIARFALYLDLSEKLFASAADRHTFYDQMRAYVKYGGQFGTEPIFNNMAPHLDLLASMIYAQDTTRFSIAPDATESADIFERLPIAAQRVQQEWHDSNADIIYGCAVRSSMATASSFVKMLWIDGELHPFEVAAENIGVLRENIGMLDRQLVIGEKYQVTQAFLKNALANHPKGEELLSKITFQEKADDQRPDASTDGSVWMSQFNVAGSMIGNVGMPSTQATDPVAVTREPQTNMIDLWIWDDDEKQYRVVTIADPFVIIYDRLGDDGTPTPLYVKGEHPYIHICPNPDQHYFFGSSEANKLIGLQDWLTERLMGIRRMMKRQANPPKIGSGLFGDDAEIAEKLTTEGGYVPASDLSTFKLEELKPTIPDDLFRDVMSIMEMFNVVSGLPKAIQGQGEAGVRSEGHALSLIRTGSARAKQRALMIESALSKAATLIWKLLCKFSKDHLIDTKGREFIPAQVGPNISVRVDAHSSSPAYIEDMRQWAADMHKAGLIDSDAYFDLTNPPQREILKQKAREMQKARAAKEQQEARDEKIVELHKHRGAA